jgi:hypothetical protein
MNTLENLMDGNPNMDENPNNIIDYAKFININILSNIDESQYNLMEIDPVMANVYIGDFHGLLKEINIINELFTITTVLNGLRSSSDYDGKFFKIKLPTEDLINNILNLIK